MIPVASDVHKRRCSFSMIPTEGKLTMLEPIECTREAWRKRLAELPRHPPTLPPPNPNAKYKLDRPIIDAAQIQAANHHLWEKANNGLYLW